MLLQRMALPTAKSEGKADAHEPDATKVIVSAPNIVPETGVAHDAVLTVQVLPVAMSPARLSPTSMCEELINKATPLLFVLPQPLKELLIKRPPEASAPLPNTMGAPDIVAMSGPCRLQPDRLEFGELNRSRAAVVKVIVDPIHRMFTGLLIVVDALKASTEVPGMMTVPPEPAAVMALPSPVEVKG